MAMVKRSWNLLTIMPLMAVWALAFGPMAGAESGQQAQMARGLLLPGEQIILGTVQDVKSDVIQVNIGQLEPLYLSLRAAAEKGISSIQRGDTTEDRRQRPKPGHRFSQGG